MATCPNCGAPLPEGVSFCTNCGAAAPVSSESASASGATYKDPYDQTGKFSTVEIAEGKLYALAAYLLGPLGMIIALLGAKNNRFTMFHLHQSLRFAILYVFLGLIAAVLCFTVIVPIVAGIAIVVLMVIELIAVIQACGGQAKEAAIIRSIDFLN